jgi:UrcA family protein
MRYSMELIQHARPSFITVIALGILGCFCGGAQADELQEITVTVPAAKNVGRDASGAPIQQISASARLQYDPIMLTTNSGRALLQDRAADVARRLCRDIVNAAPPAGDEDACVKQAVAGVKVQIAAAAAAHKPG